MPKRVAQEPVRQRPSDRRSTCTQLAVLIAVLRFSPLALASTHGRRLHEVDKRPQRRRQEAPSRVI